MSGTPYRLVANEAQSFQGSNVPGKGFMLLPEQARELIAKDPKNAEVVFPFLNGEDLNQRPGAIASRWVINFCDWSQEKAVEHPAVFATVEQEVKPIRLKATHSNSLAPSWLPTDQVFSDAVVVIAASLPAQFALLDRLLELNHTR
ncbi:hypothetical protein ACFWCA_12285 [Streptomyces phaeochromogenes]|uniref:hypothetical protein n=1 Tax=Streptomyces phaeochromogenes TaxID=1923 RepID=UPI0036CF429E